MAIVEMLLQSDNIEVNKGDYNGETPLYTASYQGRETFLLLNR